MDRKFRELSESVSQEETDRYIELLGSQITLNLSRKTGTPSLQAPGSEEGEKLTDTFDNFSTQTKMHILPLSEGESSQPILVNGQKTIITLLSIQKRLDYPLSANVRETAEHTILRYKREQSIKQWLDSLRQKAKVVNNWNE